MAGYGVRTENCPMMKFMRDVCERTDLIGQRMDISGKCRTSAGIFPHCSSDCNSGLSDCVLTCD